MLEHTPPGGRACIGQCWLSLVVDPGRKFVWTIYRNAQEHLRVLDAALLGALAKKYSGVLWVHPYAVGMIWDEVCLAGKLRNPEAVVGIG